jgi:HAD superfamily hydrolase (TIGR01662 family)
MRQVVLFDIGGPIDCETAHERAIDADIGAALAQEGIRVDDAGLANASRIAVESHAPNAYQAIIWHLTGTDRARAARVWDEVATRAKSRDLFELRDGIPDLLNDLSNAGLRLGLVANQPARIRRHLENAGMAQHFTAWALSGAEGLRKPDPRLFLAACASLGVAPADCVMVGDRIDNDIAPAKALGMATVRLRCGRHAGQKPRSWLEVPDRDVDDIAALRRVILELRDA